MCNMAWISQYKELDNENTPLLKGRTGVLSPDIKMEFASEAISPSNKEISLFVWCYMYQ